MPGSEPYPIKTKGHFIYYTETSRVNYNDFSHWEKSYLYTVKYIYFTCEDIDFVTLAMFQCWMSQSLSILSRNIFLVNLRLSSEIFGKSSETFVWPSDNIWKIFGNLRKMQPCIILYFYHVPPGLGFNICWFILSIGVRAILCWICKKAFNSK